jgi:hypothetical protein
MEDEHLIYVYSILVIFTFLLLMSIIKLLFQDDTETVDYNDTIIYAIIIITAWLSLLFEEYATIFIFPLFIILSLVIIVCDKRSFNIFS